MRVPPNVRRVRRRRRIHTKILWLLVIAAVICWAIYYGMDVRSDLTGANRNSDVTVEITEGAANRQIAALLHKAGAVRHPHIFALYNRLNGHTEFQMGSHTIPAHSDYNTIYSYISKVAEATGIKIVVPEGFEVRQIAAAVQEAGLTTAEDFIQTAQNDTFSYDFVKPAGSENRLEGYLFPATYTFRPGTSAHEIMEAMLEKMNSVYNEDFKTKAEEQNVTMDYVLTLASVIEREAANDEDRDLVASVFVNRLKAGQKLESCATVQYILQERKAVLSVADTKIKNPYNTYLYKGLPPTSIASPGAASIRAALYPADTNYRYFVLGKDGKHIFSQTYAEHQKAVRENQ